jgi:glycosyltransferase involved in cell wall biosynthesis
MNESGALRVVQVSPWERQGGGEQVAGSLARGLRDLGHDVRWIVGTKSSDDPDVIELAGGQPRGAWYRFWRSVQGRLDPSGGAFARRARRTAGWLAEPGRFADWFRGIEDFRFPGTGQLLALDPAPDLVHLHNLHGGYFDLRVLPELSRAFPTALTLHDAWMLSGHCAHSFECDRWRTGCGRCPDLSIYPAVRRDATRANWSRKQRIYAQSRLHVATPSRWLMDKVKQSMLAPALADARVIPNGVDLDVFKPQEQAKARAALGLPPDAAVLVFAANGVRQNPFKDYRTLRDAFGRLAERTTARELVLLGIGEAAQPEAVGNAIIRFVPPVADPGEMARYYAAADVYVHAALADTFPTTVLEALACGTPVVATAVGGIPEQVCCESASGGEETGVLVPPRDPEALAGAIATLLGDELLRRWMSDNAAADARRRFDADEQCARYAEWYREILAGRAAAGAPEAGGEQRRTAWAP